MGVALGTLSACGAVVHVPADADGVEAGGAADGAAVDGAHDGTSTADGGLPIRCPMESIDLPISACRREGETCVRYCYEGVSRSFLAVCKAGRWELSRVQLCDFFF